MALTLLVAATPALAQTSPTGNVDAGVHLSWIRSPAATSCADAGSVQSDVAQRLGKNPFTEPSHTFIEAAISKEGDVWQAEIAMLDARGSSLGTRKVTSDAPSCVSLGSAAGLAIALMIDPEAVSSPTPRVAPKVPTSHDAAAPVMPPRPLAQDVAAPVSASATPIMPRGSLSASLAGAARILPSVALGARVAGEARVWGRFDAALSLTFLPERRSLLAGHDVSFGLTFAELGPCYRFVNASHVQLSGCVSMQLGAIHAVLFEPGRGRTSQLLWSSASAGLHAAWVLARPLTLHTGLEAVVPLQRRDYLIERGPSDYVVVFSDPALGPPHTSDSGFSTDRAT